MDWKITGLLLIIDHRHGIYKKIERVLNNKLREYIKAIGYRKVYANSLKVKGLFHNY